MCGVLGSDALFPESPPDSICENAIIYSSGRKSFAAARSNYLLKSTPCDVVVRIDRLAAEPKSVTSSCLSGSRSRHLANARALSGSSQLEVSSIKQRLEVGHSGLRLTAHSSGTNKALTPSFHRNRGPVRVRFAARLVEKNLQPR